ncbi:MAG: SsrA-binding protein SmpB [Desulfovibrio sp.]|nr:SsrA-binding protein SmpB [Desulfovibrio sp.]
MAKKKSSAEIAYNKKARFLYELSGFLEAGIALTGAEVKSLRGHKVNFIDSYVECKNGEAWLQSLHIAPYENAGYVPQDPNRPRRLLLHAVEIRRLASAVAQKGFTIVPVRLYFAKGKIKVEIALGRGKKMHDHRESLKRRAEERDLARELS